MRAQLRALFTLGPKDNDHEAAVRVALGLAVPGIWLLLCGRPDLIIYAVFGSFAGMYGRAESPRARLRHQTQAAAILVTCAGTGVVLATLRIHPPLLVAVSAGVAAIGSLVTDRLGLRPGGPFFGIFALGAVAAVTTDRVNPWVAVSICAATALFSVAVGFALPPRTLPARSRSLILREPEVTTAGAPIPRLSASLLHSVRYVLAISLAGSVGLLLGTEHAHWAMAAAAVPLAAPDSRSRITRGIHRILGTFAGLLVTAALLLPNPSPSALAVLVMVLLFPTELFMTRNYALSLGFFTPLIMLMTDLAAPAEPMTMLTERGVDTVIGVSAGIAVAVLVRRPSTSRAGDDVTASTPGCGVEARSGRGG